MSHPVIFRASAGAGKTFALTMEFFRLIFRNPYEYKNILAVTFTNKATEEMKSRIIGELYKISRHEKSGYVPLLVEELGISREEMAVKARAALALLLHDYSRFSVTTIDRFFQQVLKAFTRELNIFPGYNVVLDHSLILEEAVERVIEKSLDDADLRRWLRQLIRFDADEGRSWNIKESIIRIGNEVFKEEYAGIADELHKMLSNKGVLEAYAGFLRSIVGTYEETLYAKGVEGCELIEKHGLETTDFKYGKTACTAYFHKLREREFSPPGKRVYASVEDESVWYKPDSPKRGLIESVLPPLMTLMRDIVDYYDRNYREYLTAQKLYRNLFQLGILEDVYAEIRNYCEEEGKLLLSDTVKILNSLIREGDTPFIYEKIGNYYKHIMIDEFQDTSVLQWKNFLPLVANSLSVGGSAFFVGDVKQSIYRWRNGDWTLLDHGVEKDFTPDYKVLNSNWRSAVEVVHFNNIFFERAVEYTVNFFKASLNAVTGTELPSSETEGEKDERDMGIRAYAKMMAAAYSDIVQKTESDERGYVDISFGPSKDEEDSDAAIMREVIDIIGNIRNRGGRFRDTAVIVRTGKEGAVVADAFMEYNKNSADTINFVSGDSLYLASSLYVSFITEVLGYMENPFDAVNKAAIYCHYHSYVLKNPQPYYFRGDEGDIFFDMTGRRSEDLRMNAGSIFERVEFIIDYYGLTDMPEEIPYITGFQDAVLDFMSQGINSVAFFLEWWEEEKNKRLLSTSEDTDAVRIITIHKSKGLEYAYVIMPFCSWELDSAKHRSILWCANRENGFDTLAYAPLYYSPDLAATFFSDEYMAEHMRSYVDNLNLLYVGFTRAKYELYVRPYAPKERKNEKNIPLSLGVYELIYRVLEDIRMRGEGVLPLSEPGILTYGQLRVFEKKAEKSTDFFRMDTYRVNTPRSLVKIRYSHSLYASDKRDKALDKGKVFHEVFRSIVTAEDAEPVLLRYMRSGLIDAEEAGFYIDIFKRSVQSLPVSEWFAKGLKVYVERDILLADGSKYRPDRVVDDGRSVTVVDYKFGETETSAHRHQVAYYCKLLRGMGYPEVKGYLWYVTGNKIVRV